MTCKKKHLLRGAVVDYDDGCEQKYELSTVFSAATNIIMTTSYSRVQNKEFQWPLDAPPAGHNATNQTRWANWETGVQPGTFYLWLTGNLLMRYTGCICCDGTILKAPQYAASCHPLYQGWWQCWAALPMHQLKGSGPLLLHHLLFFSCSMQCLHHHVPFLQSFSPHAKVERVKVSSHILIGAWTNYPSWSLWSLLFQSFSGSKGHATTVVHTNGIHQVYIEYCHCIHSISEAEQLARSSLFPVSLEPPETVFTFAVLKQFHILGLTAKVLLVTIFSMFSKHD